MRILKTQTTVDGNMHYFGRNHNPWRSVHCKLIERIARDLNNKKYHKSIRGMGIIRANSEYMAILHNRLMVYNLKIGGKNESG